tara:strand:- start:216 stop:887 length:672 start_codon:yes stop_codon:yes gene_type:complete
MKKLIKKHIKAIATVDESHKLLALLLLADLAFISIHCLFIAGILSGPSYSIEVDLGFAEIYQYIKEFWIIVLLLLLAIKERHFTYLLWSLLFVFLLLDDSFTIHEEYGEYLSNYFEFKPMFNLRAKDFGELVVSLFSGFILLTSIGVSLLFSDNLAKQTSKKLFFLLIMLAFFGVFVDMLHVALPLGKSILGLIEDGGEMIVISITVWYTFGIETSQENLSDI